MRNESSGDTATNTLHCEMAGLFAAFLPPEVAARFCELLSLKPARWHKIDPWKVWQLVGSGGVQEWNGGYESLLRSQPFSHWVETPVTVLRCGHDDPAIYRLPMREALTGKAALLEGFISVVPAKLGVAKNHDGMLCLLSQ